MKSAQKIICLVCLTLVFLSALFAAEWYGIYNDALTAIKKEEWQRAVDLLNQVLANKSKPKVNARTYGLNFIDYLPYAYRGIARYHLGDREGAREDFKVAEDYGHVRKARRDKVAARRLQSYLASMTISHKPEAMTVDPGKAALDRGVQAFKNKDYEAARGEFKRVLQLESNHPVAKNYLSKIDGELRRSANVEPTQDGGSEIAETAPRAGLLPARKRPETSVSKKAAGERSSAEAFQQGVRFFEAGDYNKAKLRFQKVRTTAASYEKAAGYLAKISRVEQNVKAGILAFFEGENQNSIEKLTEASLIYRANPDILVLLGSAYATKYLLSGEEDNKLLEMAMQNFAKVKELDPAYLLDAKYFSPKIVDMFTGSSKN